MARQVGVGAGDVLVAAGGIAAMVLLALVTCEPGHRVVLARPCFLLPGMLYGRANAVTSWEPRRLDVFAPSSNGRALLHRWFDGSAWRGPETLATGTGPDHIPLRGIAAAAWAPGRLDVFSTNAGIHGLTHTWFNGRWNGPERLDFAGPTQTLLADPAPRSSPIPVDPRVFDLPGDAAAVLPR